MADPDPTKVQLWPKAQLVLPRYSREDTFAMFARFIDRQGFGHTASVLARELQAHGVVASAQDANLSSGACRVRDVTCGSQKQSVSPWKVVIKKNANLAQSMIRLPCLIYAFTDVCLRAATCCRYCAHARVTGSARKEF